MKKYIVRKTQRATSLSRQKTLRSEDQLRSSSIGQRQSQASDMKSLRDIKGRTYAKSMTRTDVIPYDTFVRDLKIKLPTPKQKFYEFLRIAPFNRIHNQNELISLFIKNIKFFKLHQPNLVTSLARKVKLVDLYQIDDKMMVIVLQGCCRYRGLLYTTGQLINRQQMKLSDIQQFDPSTTKLIAFNRHQYLSFLNSFINQQMIKFKEFINGIQTFKMFSQKTLQKFTENMTLHYYLKGEKLYRIGEEANTLFVVYSGLVSRKVIIELEQINKIPPYAKKDKDGLLHYEKYKRDVRILTKEYEHKIQFHRDDILGVTEIIDKVSTRKQEIDVDEDSILLGIDRSIVEESMDDYILDHLKKYNLKKYPSSYDELCENYLKQKLSTRKMQERKIMAMQNQLKMHYNNRRREKIEFIIKMYESNIKNNQKVNLKKQRLQFQVDKNK